MKCSCCDRNLSDSESTAQFLNPDGSRSGRYVDMCGTCRGFLPNTILYVCRQDFEESKDEDDTLYDPFDLGDTDDESW